MESTKKKKMQFPHPVIFLLLLALLMLILSWIIPAGHYMAIDANGVVQGAEGYDTATGTLIYDDAHFFQESAPHAWVSGLRSNRSSMDFWPVKALFS